MQKKMMAVAVAGALGAPALALAQASTVQVYGTIYLEYAYIDQGGGGGTDGGAGGDAQRAAPSEYNKIDLLQTPGSEIGFRGEEKLGGNMSAWFQCNSTFDVRGSSPQGFCGRNSAVGLKGGWGSVAFGNWDTPFKKIAGANRIVNETGAWGASFMLTGAASSYNGRATPQSFSRRQNNAIFYDSPSFSGFSFGLMMDTMSSGSTASGANGTFTNNPNGIASASTTNATAAKPRLYSISAAYNAANWNVGLAYEQHKNYWSSAGGQATTASVGGAAVSAGIVASAYDGTDQAWVLTGGYTFRSIGLRLGAIYTWQDFDTAMSATGTGLKVQTWNLAADWNISGPHSVQLGYTQANDTKGSYTGSIGAGTNQRVGNAGAGSTGGALWQLGYKYALSKRTTVGVTAGWLKNEDNGRYSMGGALAPRNGENQSAYGVQMRHTF